MHALTTQSMLVWDQIRGCQVEVQCSPVLVDLFISGLVYPQGWDPGLISMQG